MAQDNRSNEQKAKEASQASKAQADKRRIAIEGTSNVSKERKAKLDKGFPLSTGIILEAKKPAIDPDTKKATGEEPRTKKQVVKDKKKAVKEVEDKAKKEIRPPARGALADRQLQTDAVQAEMEGKKIKDIKKEREDD